MRGGDVPTVHGGKVLVVDDDADWRGFLTQALEELGYTPAEARSGEEALEALASDHCSVMLLDLNMPGMRGEEVLKHLPRHAPKVVVVTSAQADDASGALMHGPHYYLPKGASREELALLLQSLDP